MPNEPIHPIETEVRRWLDEVVIGLNLCPFAAHPARSGRVRVVVSEAQNEVALLAELQIELALLDDSTPAQIETTLIAVPRLFAEFADYNDFLDQVDGMLDQFEWSGIYQVASFHPDYQFADTEPDDPENLTNRAPYPLLHLLREDSVEAAVDSHPDVDAIPENNIRRMREMDAATRARLFAYLKREDNR
ncbi:DUF1415 domain-containing protein [Solimonas terrae]|uniref:DUF1415 domain-containing protein n=1 Tax=Solimonas terrae TaxID=1396819 RepID=A0A6M2BR47_9GAMM|nr:DUF1415 domain-containing protein [Solimonas terrae]NGY04958.1 DUF1415 domain-containing protein [Solimonas terrae]